MRRRVGLGTLLILLLALAPEALAQYGPPPPPGCPVTPPTPPGPPAREGFPPCGPQRPRGFATVSNDRPRAGESTTVTAPASSFAPGTTVNVFLVRLRNGATPVQVGTGTVGSDGAVSVTVTIPADTQPGVYLLYMQGTGGDSSPRVVLAPVVVRPQVSASGGTLRAASMRGSGDAGARGPAAGIGGTDAPALGQPSAPVGGDGRVTGASSPSAPVPPQVAEVQRLQAAEEAAAVAAAEKGAVPVLAGDRLEMRGEVAAAAPQDSGSGPSPVALAVALLLVVTGLVALRLRSGRAAA